MFDIFNSGRSGRKTNKWEKSPGKGFLGSDLNKELTNSIGFDQKIKGIKRIRRKTPRKKCSKSFYKKFRKKMMDGINSLT